MIATWPPYRGDRVCTCMQNFYHQNLTACISTHPARRTKCLHIPSLAPRSSLSQNYYTITMANSTNVLTDFSHLPGGDADAQLATLGDAPAGPLHANQGNWVPRACGRHVPDAQGAVVVSSALLEHLMLVELVISPEVLAGPITFAIRPAFWQRLLRTLLDKGHIDATVQEIGEDAARDLLTPAIASLDLAEKLLAPA